MDYGRVAAVLEENMVPFIKHLVDIKRLEDAGYVCQNVHWILDRLNLLAALEASRASPEGVVAAPAASPASPSAG